jgi:alanine racemase
MHRERMRPTWVEVDLDAIAHNVRQLAGRAPGAQLMAVVKANGYGHGADWVAEVAVEAGAAWIGVAILEEGLELRRAGITAPILIFGYVPPAQADMILLYDLRMTVFHLEQARAAAQWARALMRTMPVHVKVDTGMSRVGVPPAEAVPFIKSVLAIPGVELEGIYTHLAVADEPENRFTAAQLESFDEVLRRLEEEKLLPPLRHAANSAGILLHPAGHYNMVRAGIALYGLPPAPGIDWQADLRPALTWKTRISYLKEVEAGTGVSYGHTYRTGGRERLATLPVGYADGLSRNLSNKGEVLIGGTRCQFAGRVCMDQTVVRVPEGVPAEVGDEAVLIGRQGTAEITATEVAGLLGTINYEVVCAISARVPRIYRRGDRMLTRRDRE